MGRAPILTAITFAFNPAINEELGATSVWGSQQVGLFPCSVMMASSHCGTARDRVSTAVGDALKHGNAAGSGHGGVLLLAGDDHTCKSSTLPHQSEYAFMDAAHPGAQSIRRAGDPRPRDSMDWAMSRYSGCWIAFKTIAETVDSSASV